MGNGGQGTGIGDRRARGRASYGAAVAKALPFDKRLVLNRWLLSLFEVASFNELADWLKDPDYEGFGADNVSHYCRVLQARLIAPKALPADLLLAYDQNIVRHWQAIAEKRGELVVPKYFQYLALLFAEIYLDRFFRDPNALLAELNAFRQEFNTGLSPGDQIDAYTLADLNKIAFWQATGSGKTLQMHVNLLQYRHYLEKHGRTAELNRTILLTPNEGLSRQHLREFNLSGIPAELFVKDGGGLFVGKSIEIIDIHKLKEESGDKTVAVEAFEGNNLVLVDEGHRGAGGADWLNKRNQLCARGFSFEYSATFGQAVKAANKRDLTQQYAKCILFDYSYKYFYADGYGKDYHILNLNDDSDEEIRQLYLTAGLLTFYQQVRLYRDQPATFNQFLIESPLWVFVGGSVTKTISTRDVSDVVDILQFVAGFVGDRARTIERIDRLLKGRAGLLDAQGRDIFANAFAYLLGMRQTPSDVFDDVLKLVFNAASPALLHVEQLKGTDGEVALRLGGNDAFGVVNVGDAAGLCKVCKEQADLVVTDREFVGSLFGEIDRADSPINLLIGSKKFTEGWSSWRVSTMGLMHVGRSEGSEIIQLFGRGVRLKGYGFSLKRSSHVPRIRPPREMRILETLNIFGIHADYMRQFEEYLREEGISTNENRVEFVLPVVKTLGDKKLTTIRIKQGIDFKKTGPKPLLDLVDPMPFPPPVTLDWYPRIQSEWSSGARSAAAADLAVKDVGRLEARHIAFMDLDRLYFDLVQFKNERGWYNLKVTRESLGRILGSSDWYRLLIPREELAIAGFGRVRRWQEIAATLLRKYCEWFYRKQKNDYELPNLEYADLTPADLNFVDQYRFELDESQDSLLATLRQLKDDIQRGNLRDVEQGNFQVTVFDRHLYQPLLYLKSELVEVRPVALNDGERNFVRDLRAFYNANPDFFKGKELYLLRNQSRGRGIGFFEADNFHPDFILWLLVGGTQYVTFVDPKGIRNLEGPDDPKIAFARTIKQLEQRLGDPRVILNSFILSNTRYAAVGWWDEGMSKAEFESRNVLFQEDDRGAYIKAMLDTILLSAPSSI